MAAAGLIGGCSSSGSKSITDPDPSMKIPAIKASVETRDFSNVRQMVKDLDSDDPAVRFYAISGLEKLTGQNFGYQYFVDEDKRALAVGKWKAWLQGWEAAQHDSSRK